MPRFSDFTFLSCDGQTPIHVRRCDPEGAVRGVVREFVNQNQDKSQKGRTAARFFCQFLIFLL